MKKISIYSILIIGIAVLSYYLPYFYAITFIEKGPSSIVYYSPVIEDFMMRTYDNKKVTYMDRVGNEYSYKEFKQLNPILFYRDLYITGDFPDYIGGNYVTIEDVQQQFESINIDPKIYIEDITRIKLYPLYESKGESANLEFPKELFKIDERMEFIDGATIKVHEEKTSHYTKALLEKGFAFPAKKIGGNVDPRKRMDYGYFIVDSGGDLFHLRQEKGQAKVDKTEFSKEYGNVTYIYVNESNGAKHYALLITETGKVYFLMKDNYQIKELPIESYNPRKETLRIFVDPLYYSAKVSNYELERHYAVNNDFSIKDVYCNQLTSNMHPFFEKIFNAIFPFTISEDKYNPAAPLQFMITEKITYALIFNLMLTVAYIFFIKRKYGLTGESFIDGLIILVTGIYGLLALIILNKERGRYFGFRAFN